MNSRKGQNSILFLTTLGVYLGLVLVGANPQLIAQTSPTRQSDVGRAKRSKNGQDNREERRTPVSDSVLGYFQDVEYLFAYLGRLKDQSDLSYKNETFDVEQATALPCVERNTVGSFTPLKFEYVNSSTRWALERFGQNMIHGYSLGDCLPNELFHGVEAVFTEFRYKLDKSEFAVDISIKKRSPQNASDLLRELRDAADIYRTNSKAPLTQRIIASTSFNTKNDQVFVITRLPRASIDTLLAKDAK